MANVISVVGYVGGVQQYIVVPGYNSTVTCHLWGGGGGGGGWDGPYSGGNGTGGGYTKITLNLTSNDVLKIAVGGGGGGGSSGAGSNGGFAGPGYLGSPGNVPSFSGGRGGNPGPSGSSGGGGGSGGATLVLVNDLPYGYAGGGGGGAGAGNRDNGDNAPGPRGQAIPGTTNGQNGGDHIGDGPGSGAGGGGGGNCGVNPQRGERDAEAGFYGRGEGGYYENPQGVIPGGTTSSFYTYAGQAGYGGLGAVSAFSGGGGVGKQGNNGAAVLEFESVSLQVKSDGFWQGVKKVWVKEGILWRPVKATFLKQNGAWVPILGADNNNPPLFSFVAGNFGVSARAYSTG
jgi:hypothetical protein